MIKFKVFLLILVSAFILLQCSFDTKSRIWKNTSDETELLIANDRFKELIDLGSTTKSFDLIKNSNNLLEIENFSPENINKWNTDNLNSSNFISNINYINKKVLNFKSKRLAKFNEFQLSRLFEDIPILMVDDDRLVSFDQKGTIYVYSKSSKKKIFQYNFYRKFYKRIFKILNLRISEKNILVATDNLGFAYALDLNNYQLIWAKNFGVPLRSNILIENNQVFFSDENNDLYSVNIENGENIWKLSTQKSNLNSEFKSNISSNAKTNSLFFLTTAGELYSIDYAYKKIKWVLNFRNPTNKLDIFHSIDPVNFGEFLFLSSNKNFIAIDQNIGKIIWSNNYETRIIPKFSINNLNIYTENGYLVSINALNGELNWSKKIYIEVEENFKLKKKNIGEIIDFFILNDVITLFSKNGYMIQYDAMGNILSLNKVSKSIFSNVIIVDSKIYFLDNTFRLISLS